MARPVYTSAGPCYVKKKVRRSKSERNTKPRGKGKPQSIQRFLLLIRKSLKCFYCKSSVNKLSKRVEIMAKDQNNCGEYSFWPKHQFISSRSPKSLGIGNSLLYFWQWQYFIATNDFLEQQIWVPSSYLFEGQTWPGIKYQMRSFIGFQSINLLKFVSPPFSSFLNPWTMESTLLDIFGVKWWARDVVSEEIFER